jgi:hypothetical protein
MATEVNIAVLLGSTGDGHWTATVVCEEGPTCLLPARPHEQAITDADAEAWGMVEYGPYDQARVWRLDTTEDNADSLLRHVDPAALVRHVMAIGTLSGVIG